MATPTVVTQGEHGRQRGSGRRLLAGTWQGWDAGATPMTDVNAWYTTTHAPGTHSKYKFINGNALARRKRSSSVRRRHRPIEMWAPRIARREKICPWPDLEAECPGDLNNDGSHKCACDVDARPPTSMAMAACVADIDFHWGDQDHVHRQAAFAAETKGLKSWFCLDSQPKPHDSASFFALAWQHLPFVLGQSNTEVSLILLRRLHAHARDVFRKHLLD